MPSVLDLSWIYLFFLVRRSYFPLDQSGEQWQGSYSGLTQLYSIIRQNSLIQKNCHTFWTNVNCYVLFVQSLPANPGSAKNERTQKKKNCELYNFKNTDLAEKKSA